MRRVRSCVRRHRVPGCRAGRRSRAGSLGWRGSDAGGTPGLRPRCAGPGGGGRTAGRGRRRPQALRVRAPARARGRAGWPLLVRIEYVDVDRPGAVRRDQSSHPVPAGREHEAGRTSRKGVPEMPDVACVVEQDEDALVREQSAVKAGRSVQLGGNLLAWYAESLQQDGQGVERTDGWRGCVPAQVDVELSVGKPVCRRGPSAGPAQSSLPRPCRSVGRSASVAVSGEQLVQLFELAFSAGESRWWCQQLGGDAPMPRKLEIGVPARPGWPGE